MTHVLQQLRTQPKVVLINLCLMLIGAQLAFLVGVDKTSPRVNCQITAALIEYFLLAAFMVRFRCC